VKDALVTATFRLVLVKVQSEESTPCEPVTSSPSVQSKL
jgi:hypothetical protein